MNDDNLIWIDLEMTGLNPDGDRIIEIATVVTDKSLNRLAEGPVRAIQCPEAQLAAMDAWNQKTHGESGLVRRIRAEGVPCAEAERETLAFVRRWVAADKSPMCGNGICQDRRFLFRWMPTLLSHFHYRNLDVSTLKELARRWRPELIKGLQKESAHTALADIYESIEELRYYREHFIRSADDAHSTGGARA